MSTTIPSNTASPLIERETISIGIIGSTPGNGHPYSWSAIFNGYDQTRMTAECPFPGIPEYLNKQPSHTLGIPGAKVTHICCEGSDEFSAEHVASCSLIPNVVSSAADLIGKVDAIIVATDIGSEHVERCRPFVEVGIPLCVDKPMVDNESDLRVFDDWVASGHPVLSSSSMRYTKEFLPYRRSTHDLGPLRSVTITMAKKWETYGIHALEAIYPILGPGFLTCRNIGSSKRNIVHFTHESGTDVIVLLREDMGAGSGVLTLTGAFGDAHLKSADSYFAFKTQMESFISYLKTGHRPFPYSETNELMRMLIAGILSRDGGGTQIDL